MNLGKRKFCLIVFKLLQLFFCHFSRCRGQIKVKGKGDMITYFLCDNTQNPLNGDREFRGMCPSKPFPNCAEEL